MKIKTHFLLSIFFILLNTKSTFAEQYLDLVRITCIPEIPLLIASREIFQDDTEFLDIAEYSTSTKSEEEEFRNFLLAVDKKDKNTTIFAGNSYLQKKWLQVRDGAHLNKSETDKVFSNLIEFIENNRNEFMEYIPDEKDGYSLRDLELSFLNSKSYRFEIEKYKPHLAKSINILRKHGYLLANQFDYTCKFPHATFRIWGNTPPHLARGLCGGNPRTKISVSRNDEIVIDNAFFEPSCFQDDSGFIKEITANGRNEEEGQNTEFSIKIGKNLDILASFSSHEDSDKFQKVDQKYLNCILSEQKPYSRTYFNDIPSISREMLNKCVQEPDKK